MTQTSEPIGRLIGELARLPGIGERSAARLAYHIIKISRRYPGKTLAQDLAAALIEVDDKVGLCTRCANLCAGELCRVCSESSRQTKVLCVVEGVSDLRAIERAGSYRGLYHVLHGALSPLEGLGPEELKIDDLVARVGNEGIEEIILATNANVDGDATALYIAQLMAPLQLKVTRLAAGIPMGGELEYLDGATLGRALTDRRAFAF